MFGADMLLWAVADNIDDLPIKYYAVLLPWCIIRAIPCCTTKHRRGCGTPFSGARLSRHQVNRLGIGLHRQATVLHWHHYSTVLHPTVLCKLQ